ncbi:MAG: 4Fe-4S binding protein [Promethearchaeota archaeon]
MPRNNFFFKIEQKFIKDALESGVSVLKSSENSPQDGFTIIDELKKEEFKLKMGKKQLKNMIKALPAVAGNYMIKIIISIRKSFKILYPYLEDPTRNIEDNINPKLWEDLNRYSRDKWGIIKIGFTKLPKELIFRDKLVLFPHVLIFVMEMDKKKIDTAPNVPAGKEAMRIYAKLGIAVNDIADWLRTKGIRCQSNHPLRGLTLTPPLGGKSGIGWQGRQGLLITPEFGPRVRLAPIYIENKCFEFTDSLEHKWIEEYCKICNRCIRECPVGAIWEEKKVIGKRSTCIDIIKCFPYFSETLGCSVCIKVCPFSEGFEFFESAKLKFTKNLNK